MSEQSKHEDGLADGIAKAESAAQAENTTQTRDAATADNPQQAYSPASSDNPQHSRSSVQAKTTPQPEDAPRNAEEDFSSFADLTGFDVMTTEPAIAPAPPHYPRPDRTDVMPPVGNRGNVVEYHAPKAEKSYLGVPVKIAIGVAAALLVVAGVGLLAQPGTIDNIQRRIAVAQDSSNEVSTSNATNDSETSDTSSQTTEAEASTAAVSSINVSDSQAYVDDDTAFDILVTTYDKLQSYNDRVYSCMQTYNSVFLLPDKTQREAAAGIANSLLAEIGKDVKTLDSMNIGKASDLYDDYQNVRRLLDDQYQRLAVLVESWDISLSYDTPIEHQEEILEPLTRDIGPTGQSVYLEDFDANYWDSRPTR